MNCKDFESMIHELVSRRVGDKTKQLEALDHAGHCLWCALRLDEETRLTQSLRAFAATLHARRAPVRLEEELLQAFRERTSRATAPRLWLAGKRLWRGLSWGLAFAATVAVAWTVVWQGPRLHPRSRAPQPQAARNQPLASPEAFQAKEEAALGSRVATEVAPVAHAGLAGFGLEGSALSAGEVTTDFFSLGTCDDSQCMEEATLVRVTLPAEALLAFGLAMDTDYAPEGLVQADVALGSGGVPFAIRFVE